MAIAAAHLLHWCLAALRWCHLGASAALPAPSRRPPLAMAASSPVGLQHQGDRGAAASARFYWTRCEMRRSGEDALKSDGLKTIEKATFCILRRSSPKVIRRPAFWRARAERRRRPGGAFLRRALGLDKIGPMRRDAPRIHRNKSPLRARRGGGCRKHLKK